MSALRLGIDVGGTKLAVGVVDEAGRVLAQRRRPTAGAGDGEALLAVLAELAADACCEAATRPEAVAGVGVGLPGPVDPRTQRGLMVPDLPGLEQFPVAEYLAKRWNHEAGDWVRVENDASAAALGEALYGAGRGAAVVCYFTISTGIGGGVVIGRQVFRGASGQAGEFGHLKLRADGPSCRCGDRGCLEALASGTAIARRAREAGWWPDGGPTAEQVAAGARAGDAAARAVWEAAMADLGAGVATVVNLFNPDVVVLGGGVSRSADLVLPAVRRVVAERAMPMLAAVARIEAAALGDDVGIVGAAALLEEA